MKNQKEYLPGSGSTNYRHVKGGIMVEGHWCGTTTEISFSGVKGGRRENLIRTPITPIGPDGGYLGPWREETWETFVPYGTIFILSQGMDRMETFYVASQGGAKEIHL
jgi:hypothetical protein